MYRNLETARNGGVRNGGRKGKRPFSALTFPNLNPGTGGQRAILMLGGLNSSAGTKAKR